MNYPLTNLFENGVTWRKKAFCSSQLAKLKRIWRTSNSTRNYFIYLLRKGV